MPVTVRTVHRLLRVKIGEENKKIRKQRKKKYSEQSLDFSVGAYIKFDLPLFST